MERKPQEMIYNNVLEAIGHTPMVRLNRLSQPDSAEILVKYEGVNVGGSVKTRTAYNMIAEAEKKESYTKIRLSLSLPVEIRELDWLWLGL